MNPHTNQGHTSYFSAKSTSPCYGVGVKREYFSSSSDQTKKIARSLARSLAPLLARRLAPLFLKKRSKKQALIIALSGELGSGKTTFLQGFAKGLGIKEKILSPTFVIIKRFQFNNLTIKQFNNFFHIDCYRIKKPRELLALGFKEIISKSKNIVAIEWADKIRKILPKNSAWINFEFIDEKARKITIKS